MSFTHRLPREAEGKRFSVITPRFGLRGAIDEVLNHFAVVGDDDSLTVDKSAHIDLEVIWEYSRRMRIRVFLTPSGLHQKSDAPSVYMIGGTLGVLLTKAGRDTGYSIRVSGWLTTEPETVGTIAGMLTIESLSADIGSEAS